jgi:hypothetical protein
MISKSINGASPETITKVVNYFIGKGYSKLAAAYITGSLIQESRLDPKTPNGGLNQWQGNRATNLPSTLDGQLDYAYNEIKDKYPSAHSALINQSSTLTQVQKAIQDWTRWGILGNRWKYGEQIHKEIEKNPDAFVGTNTTGATGANEALSAIDNETLQALDAVGKGNIDTILDVLKANELAGTKVDSLSLNALVALRTLIEDSMKPKKPSYQIIAEAARAGAVDDSLKNSAVIAQSALAQSKLSEQIKESELAKKVLTNPTEVKTETLAKCAEKTGQNCTAVAEAIAKNFGDGSVIINPQGALYTAANQSYTNIDGAQYVKTFQTFIESQDSINLAQNSHLVLSNLISQESQVTFNKTVTNINTALDTVGVNKNSNTQVSLTNSITGVAENTLLGAFTNIYGEDRTVVVGGQGVSVHSDNTAIMSGNNIGITAGSPVPEEGSIKPHADAEEEAISNKPPATIVITNTGDGLTNNRVSTTIYTEGSIINSGSESIVSVAGTQANYGAQSNIVATGGNHISVCGGGVISYFGLDNWIGSFPCPLPSIPTISLPNSYPEIPPLKKISIGELEACIPDEFKKDNPVLDEEPNPTDTDSPDGTTGEDTPSQEGQEPDEQTEGEGEVDGEVEGRDRPVGERENEGEEPTISGRDTSSTPSLNKSSKAPVNVTSGSSGVGNTAANNPITIPKHITTLLDSGVFGNLPEDSDFSDYEELKVFGNNILNITEIDLKELIEEQADSYLEKIEPKVIIEGLAKLKELGETDEISTKNSAALQALYLDWVTNPSKIEEVILNKTYTDLKTPTEELELIKQSIESGLYTPQEVFAIFKKNTTAVGFFGLGSVFNVIQDTIGGLGGLGDITSILDWNQLCTNITAGGFCGGELGNITFNNLWELLDVGIDESLSSTLFDLGQSLIQGTEIDIPELLDILLGDSISKVIETIMNGIDLAAIYNDVVIYINKTIEQGVSFTLEDIIKIVNTVEPSIGEAIRKGEEIYNAAVSVVEGFNTGDLEKILESRGLGNLVGMVLGDDIGGIVDKIQDIIASGVGIYRAIEALPQLLGLMDAYGISTLDQIFMALGCLDLFDRLSNLLDAFNAFTTEDEKRLETARALDNLDRAAQFANSIIPIPVSNTIINTLRPIYNSPIENINNGGFTPTPDSQIGDKLNNIKRNYYKNLERVNFSSCFKLPQLNYKEATLEFISIVNRELFFSIPNINLYRNKLNLLPGQGDIIRTNISSFDLDSLTYHPYQSANQYTPNTYSWVVVDYNPALNIGKALFRMDVNTIVLQGNDGLLYEFYTAQIGGRIVPNIRDIYLYK